MNEREKELLTAARELLMGEHIEDACTHYYAAHEENSKNAEAEFFGDYLAYSSLIEERNGAAAARALDAMTKNIEKAVASIKEAEFKEDTSETDITGAEQQELCRLILISKMVKIYTPITRFLFTGRLSTTRDTRSSIRTPAPMLCMISMSTETSLIPGTFSSVQGPSATSKREGMPVTNFRVTGFRSRPMDDMYGPVMPRSVR